MGWRRKPRAMPPLRLKRVLKAASVCAAVSFLAKSHAAESVRGTCDKYARHYSLPLDAFLFDRLFMPTSGGLFPLRLPLKVEGYAQSQNDCGDAEQRQTSNTVRLQDDDFSRHRNQGHLQD